MVESQTNTRQLAVNTPLCAAIVSICMQATMSLSENELLALQRVLADQAGKIRKQIRRKKVYNVL